MAKDNKENKLKLLVADDDKGLKRQDAALRIFDGKKQVFYNSTRLGGVKKTATGYEVEVPDEFTGLTYELKKIGTKKILAGTVGDSNNKNLAEKKKA